MLSKVKKILLILLSLACLGMGGYYFFTNEVPIFVAPVTDGHVIKESDLTTKRVLSNQIPTNVIKSKEYLLGKSVVGGVSADTLIPSYAINGDSGSNGDGVQNSSNTVTVSLIVTGDNVPKDLRIGDKVGIAAYFDLQNLETYSVLFPVEGMIQAIKTDAEGFVSGVDVNVNLDSSVDLLYASQVATLQIIKLNGSSNQLPDSTDSNKIYAKYFNYNLNTPAVQEQEPDAK